MRTFLEYTLSISNIIPMSSHRVPVYIYTYDLLYLGVSIK